MKILRLADARVLLWATESAADPPFEVSRVVPGPLQPLCPSAPRCPSELAAAKPFDRPPAWLDPTEPPTGVCAYNFTRRGECLRHRNRTALEAALFEPGEARRVHQLLVALGYRVREETIDAGRGGRILLAHGAVGSSHQVRVVNSPGLGALVLVRELPEPAAAVASTTELRVLPAGGG